MCLHILAFNRQKIFDLRLLVILDLPTSRKEEDEMMDAINRYNAVRSADYGSSSAEQMPFSSNIRNSSCLNEL